MLTKLEIIQHQDFDVVWVQVYQYGIEQAESQVKYPTKRYVGEQVEDPVYDQMAAQVEFQLLDQIQESA